MIYIEAQQEAIECTDRNLQIIVCAGYGKTQVISALISRLRLEQLGTNFSSGTTYVGTILGYCLNLLQSPHYPLKHNILNNILQRLLIDLNFSHNTSAPTLTPSAPTIPIPSCKKKTLPNVIIEDKGDRFKQQSPALSSS